VFPAGNKACGEWFPKRERALATGIFSSGSAVGAVIAPPVIAWLTLTFGWRYAFVLPGMVGLLLLPLWLWIYRSPGEHPWVSAQESAFLRAEQDSTPRRPWGQLLKQRKVWALVLPRLASDPVWYFYLFWLPDYLQRGRHLSLHEIGIYGWIPFLFADIGNVLGGALSDWMVRRGVPAPRARMTMLAMVGILSPFGALVGLVDSAVVAVAITCLVTLLCQCAATNMATLAIDLMPRQETASVIGMMGTAGSLGGVLFSQVLGIVIGGFGYPSAFMLAAVLHPIAMLTLFALLRPTLRQAAVSTRTSV
jgi:ACS family hexuronate transporter-like MFS transporter